MHDQPSSPCGIHQEHKDVMWRQDNIKEFTISRLVPKSGKEVSAEFICSLKKCSMYFIWGHMMDAESTFSRVTSILFLKGVGSSEELLVQKE